MIPRLVTLNNGIVVAEEYLAGVTAIFEELIRLDQNDVLYDLLQKSRNPKYQEHTSTIRILKTYKMTSQGTIDPDFVSVIPALLERFSNGRYYLKWPYIRDEESDLVDQAINSLNDDELAILYIKVTLNADPQGSRGLEKVKDFFFQGVPTGQFKLAVLRTVIQRFV